MAPSTPPPTVTKATEASAPMRNWLSISARRPLSVRIIMTIFGILDAGLKAEAAAAHAVEGGGGPTALAAARDQHAAAAFAAEQESRRGTRGGRS